MIQEPENTSPGDGKTLLFLSILSGVIWLLLGILIVHYFQKSSLREIFAQGSLVTFQIALGTMAGAVVGFTGIILIRMPAFKKILDEYAIIRQVKQLSFSVLQIFYVSLIAGISEEILFRGALQPLIGIWLTSLLFIGVHGYIRIHTITHFLYTLFTLLLSMVLGLLFIYFGLIASIAAHFIYDVVVLFGIKQEDTTIHSPDE